MAMFYLENTPHAVTRNGIHISTQNHFDYICREGKYEKLNAQREDLVFKKSGNLPDWAKSGKEYWESAEQHRHFKNRAYREVRMALQEELTLEENIELVEKFCAKMGIADKHAYTYAIHDKPAAFDPSHRNIHCHLMFDERVIEKNRRLDESRYFARYAETKEGKPTGGYRKDRYFHSKECTIEMRRVWAELVNEKFAEKGLECRISEKTLKAQYDELMKAGKEDDAVYFKRERAPHLGNIYKNPKKMKKIAEFTQKLQEEIDAYTDDENPKPYSPYEEGLKTKGQVKDLSNEELKMYFFAADLLARKVARNLQQAFKEERRFAPIRERYIQEENFVNDVRVDAVMRFPAVTVGDIEDAMAEKAEQCKKAAEEQMKLYKDLKKQLLSDEVIAAKAEADVFPQGRKIIDTWNEAKKERDAYNNALCTFDTTRKDYGDFLHKCLVASNKFTAADFEYQKYKAEKYNRSKEVQTRIEEIKKEQADILAQSKKAYRTYKYQTKQQEMYEVRIGYMEQNFEEDKIIFAKELPKMLMRNHRLNGKVKVGSLVGLEVGNSTYRLLVDKKTVLDPDNKKPIRAVREGDDVVDGKVPVYDLNIVLSTATNKNGQPYTKIGVKHICKTGEIKLYRAHNQMGYGYKPFPKEILERSMSAKTLQGLLDKRAGQLKKIANYFADNPPKVKQHNNETNGNLINLKTNEDRQMKKHDAYEEAEEALESWSRGMRSGGRM